MEILPGRHLIPGISWSRAYLIEGETLALVDSGMFWNGRAVLRYIASIGRQPEDLSHILVTHKHPDHVGGIRHVSKRTGAAVAAHPNDMLPIGGGVRVIHTPGHTDGSVCFLHEPTRTLFSGDTIFSDGKRISRSVPFPGYDGPAYRESLKRLANMDFSAVCGGHGIPLLEGGAGILGDLLDARPDPPTWGKFIKSMPKRLRRSLPLAREHF